MNEYKKPVEYAGELHPPIPLPMPNKYYLREDRTACSPTMKEPIQWDYETISMYNWSQHLLSLPVLDVDADYLKRLSPGWFEGSERYEVKVRTGDWLVVDKDTYDRWKSHLRRLTIVAPQEAEKVQEGGTVKTLSKVLTELWEEARERHTPTGKYYDKWTNSETDCIQRAMDAILTPATPQPVTGEEISFAELKWNIGSLFNQNIRISDNGKAIEGNPAVHAIAEYVHNLLAASRPTDAVEFAEWMKENQIVSSGERHWISMLSPNPQPFTTKGLYNKFLQSKSPNPNK